MTLAAISPGAAGTSGRATSTQVIRRGGVKHRASFKRLSEGNEGIGLCSRSGFFWNRRDRDYSALLVDGTRNLSTV